MELRLTATSVKHWFQYRCERKLVYGCMRPEERQAIPIAEEATDAPWAELGNQYEEAVVARYAREQGVRLLIPPPKEEYLNFEMSLAFLQRRTEHTAAHQIVVQGTDALREYLQLEDLPDVKFRRGFVDILLAHESEDGTSFRLVDIKSTQVALPFQKAQVAWYGWMLRGLLATHNPDAEVDPVAEIWHRPPRDDAATDEFTRAEFSLRSYESLIRDWTRRELRRAASRVVDGSHDTTQFHIYFKCEQCSFLKHCMGAISPKRPVELVDLSAIAGMSHQAKTTLRSENIKSVGALLKAKATLLSGQSEDWRLRTRGVEFVARAKALRDNEVSRISERVTLKMPPKSDVKIYLVADRDPMAGRLATLGTLILRTGREVVREICTIDSLESERTALLTVLGTVLQVLHEVDQENSKGAQKILHFFVYEPAESRDLAGALGAHLDDSRILTSLLHLIRLFPPEQTNPEPEYRGYHHLPAAAVRIVLEELYAVPTRVSYDLRQVSAGLAQAPNPPKAIYEPSEDFIRPFSSRLPLVICDELSEGTADRDAIHADIVSRLEALSAIVDWLEAENARRGSPAEFLRLKKAPFRLHASVDPLIAKDLELLRAQTIFETRTELLATLTELALPTRVRQMRQRCMSGLKLVSSRPKNNRHWLTLLMPADRLDADISPTDFSLLLTDGHPDRLLDQPGWVNFTFDLLNLIVKGSHVEVFGSMSNDAWGSQAFQTLRSELGDYPRWVIDKGYRDNNTVRTMSFLNYLDAS